jgi:hypothetical protein
MKIKVPQWIVDIFYKKDDVIRKFKKFKKTKKDKKFL